MLIREADFGLDAGPLVDDNFQVGEGGGEGPDNGPQAPWTRCLAGAERNILPVGGAHLVQQFWFFLLLSGIEDFEGPGFGGRQGLGSGGG